MIPSEDFPKDLNPHFKELLNDFGNRWPNGGFELHLAVVSVFSKSGLCSSVEFDDFNLDLVSCNIDPAGVEYIRVVASIGRFAVHGSRDEQRAAVRWLREHYPSDELLSYSFCNE